jgi:hypothetical protein
MSLLRSRALLLCLAAASLLVLHSARNATYDFVVDLTSSSSLYARYARRGIVLVGEGCYVPVAFATATLLARHVNLSVTLFTNKEGIAMTSALAAHFGHFPYDTLVDATALIGRHEGRPDAAREAAELSVDPHCAFRLQKILTIGRPPYDHTIFMDADAFPCSARIAELFRLHDLSGADMFLMPENKHTGGYNSGFMAVRSTAATRELTLRWHDRVAASCRARKHTNVVGSVLDQPDLLRETTRMERRGELKIAQIPYELQACRPEMWKRGGDADYFEQHGLVPNASILERPPCPVAHVNPFKAPWLIQRKVDKFCDSKGLGKVSSLVYRTLKVGLAFNRTDLGVSKARADWCWIHIRRGINK